MLAVFYFVIVLTSLTIYEIVVTQRTRMVELPGRIGVPACTSATVKGDGCRLVAASSEQAGTPIRPTLQRINGYPEQLDSREVFSQ